MKKVFGRGLNIAAQINSSRGIISQFQEIQKLRNLPIKGLGCGYLQSYYLLQNNQLIRCGYFMDSLTSIRIIALYKFMPSVIKFIQKINFVGPLLSFKGGDQQLTFINKQQINEGIKFQEAYFSQSRIYLQSTEKRIYAVGQNYFGQLGTSNMLSCQNSMLSLAAIDQTDNVVYIGCGYQHTLFVTESGKVYGCGKTDSYQIQPLNAQKQYPISTFDKIIEPTLIFKKKKVKKAAAGLKFSLLLTYDGQIYTIGDNKFGQCGFNYYQHPIITSFTKVNLPFQEKIKDVVCGFCHTIILTDQNIYFMGSVEQRQNPFMSFNDNLCSPTEISLPSKPIKIFANIDRSAIITADGKAYIFGGQNQKRQRGQIGALDCLSNYNFNENSLIGLGFAHTIISP